MNATGHLLPQSGHTSPEEESSVSHSPSDTALECSPVTSLLDSTALYRLFIRNPLNSLKRKARVRLVSPWLSRSLDGAVFTSFSHKLYPGQCGESVCSTSAVWHIYHSPPITVDPFEHNFPPPPPQFRNDHPVDNDSPQRAPLSPEHLFREPVDVDLSHHCPLPVVSCQKRDHSIPAHISSLIVHLDSLLPRPEHAYLREVNLNKLKCGVNAYLTSSGRLFYAK